MIRRPDLSQCIVLSDAEVKRRFSTEHAAWDRGRSSGLRTWFLHLRDDVLCVEDLDHERYFWNRFSQRWERR